MFRLPLSCRRRKRRRFMIRLRSRITAGQQPAQNTFNYKAAQTRKVSPQSQAYQIPDKADGVADDAEKSVASVIPAEAEFRQLIGNETDGMLARFLQNKLKLMFWHRLNRRTGFDFRRAIESGPRRGRLARIRSSPTRGCKMKSASRCSTTTPSRWCFRARIFRRTGNGRSSPRKSARRCRIGKSPRISSIPPQLTQAAHTARSSRSAC